MSNWVNPSVTGVHSLQKFTSWFIFKLSEVVQLAAFWDVRFDVFLCFTAITPACLYLYCQSLPGKSWKTLKVFAFTNTALLWFPNVILLTLKALSTFLSKAGAK